MATMVIIDFMMMMFLSVLGLNATLFEICASS
jgi:hypothetical protein